MPKGEGAQAAAKKAVAVKAAASRPKSESVQQAVKDSKAIVKAATPNARENRVEDSKKQQLAKDYLKAQKTPGYKGVGSNFYEPPIKVTPKVTPKEDKGGPGPGGPGPEPVVSNPVETVVGSTGLVDGVNYKEAYQREIERLVLSLVTNAKSLLIRYNFSGIDRVPESYLDFDEEAKTETLASSFSRPESPFTLEQASLQDRFSIDLNEINNLISDLSNSAQKSQYFGSMRGGTFLPREVKLLGNGSVGYDMRLQFTSISNQDFVVKCYEVS